MDQALQAYYEAQLALVASKGWKDFVEHATDVREGLQDVRKATPESLKFAQGQLDILDWVIGWEQLVKTAYDRLQAENEDGQ